MSSLNNHLYRFGDFTIDPDQRVLFRAGTLVSVTPKVFDTLLILVESKGRIVEKEELMRLLWPDTFVDEANITFNIQQVRKCLNDDARNPRYVGTVARRGYRFLADVEVVTNNEAAPTTEDSASVKSTPLAVSSPTTNTSTRIILLAIAGVILLVGVGGMLWKLSNRLSSTQNSLLNKTSGLSRLKFEQLTVTGESRLVAMSPDGKYIAYGRVAEKKIGIWIRQLATNTNVEIIPPTGNIFGLAFANSGEYLYMVKDNPLALYRVPVLGGVPTKIVDNTQGKFSVSADDRQIAFIRQTINREGQSETSLFTVNADGTGERKLLTGTHPRGVDTPLWTPDGNSIICSYGNSTGGSQEFGLIEVNAGDGQIKELSPHKFFQIIKMNWSPRSDALILSARTDLGENSQLWKLTYPGMQLSELTDRVISYQDLSIAQNVDKAAASQMTLRSDLWVGTSREPQSLKKITQATGNFCWTPEGRLVYSSTASGNRDLWIMKPDGTQKRQLTVDEKMDVAPTVTSDNRYIVFASNRTGAFQVWRMNLDGSNQIQLTKGSPKFYLSISGDGKWVFYNTTDDWHAWKVSIDGGEPIEVAGYVAWWPSLSPDQKTIVCVGRNGLQREFLFLPASGGQPLKRIEVRGGRLTGYRIKWTPDGKALIYMTDNNGTVSMMKQSLDGTPPEEVAKFDEDELFDFDYSVDGQFLAVTRGGSQFDVVLISDLD